MTPLRRNLQRATLAASGLALAIALTACSSDGDRGKSPAGTSATKAALASVGSLTITEGFVKEPAKPDVAAAYITLTNSGDVADTVTKITSSVTDMVVPMTENPGGGMSEITEFTVPAKGTRKLTPGGEHLMLMKLMKPLHVGDQVTLTLTFAHAGSVTFTLPVKPLLATTGSSSPSGEASAGMGGMQGMPGMN